MPSNSYPVWTSGSSDAIVPQIYNWAQADRGEQTANIGRRTAWDAQAINNAQNYFQLQQQQEAQDYARRQAVQQENYNRQQQAEREALARYKFAEDQKLSRDYLTKKDEWEKAGLRDQQVADKYKFDQAALKADQVGRANAVKYFEEGNDPNRSVTDIAAMTGWAPEKIAPMQAEYSKKAPELALENARYKLAELRAKDPAKFQDKANLDAVENLLKMMLPPELRGKVALDRDRLDLVRTDAPYNISSPALEAVDTEAMANQWNKMVPDFSFAPTPPNIFNGGTSTATTPAGNSDMVPVVSPQGKKGYVSRTKLPGALKAGFTVAN